MNKQYFEDHCLIFPYVWEGHQLWSNLGEVVDVGTFGSHFTLSFTAGPILNYKDGSFEWEDFEVLCTRTELPEYVKNFMPHLKDEAVAHICEAIDNLIEEISGEEI